MTCLWVWAGNADSANTCIFSGHCNDEWRSNEVLALVPFGTPRCGLNGKLFSPPTHTQSASYGMHYLVAVFHSCPHMVLILLRLFLCFLFAFLSLFCFVLSSNGCTQRSFFFINTVSKPSLASVCFNDTIRKPLTAWKKTAKKVKQHYYENCCHPNPSRHKNNQLT